MPDAVAESLKKFSDPSLWEVRRDVPVFDEHDDFDEAKLRRIADNCNAREGKTGDACPLIIGHTAQGSEPRVVGFARNFKVGPFGPQGKKGVLSDFWYMKADFEEARKYHRRSVELWPDELFFDPIALINRTPRRDLGLLLHQKTGKSVVRYAMEDTPGAGPMPYAGEPQSGAEPPGVPRDDGTDLSPEEKRLAEKLLSYFRSQGAFGAPAGPVMNAAAMAGPMNASLPGSVKMPETTPHPDVVKMQKDVDAVNDKFAKAAEAFAKLQGEHEGLKKDFEAEKFARAEAEKKLVLQGRKADLEKLQGEGYKLDVADELELVGSMAPEQYAKHLARVRKNYSRERPPVQYQYVVGAAVDGPQDKIDPETGRPKELTAEEAAKVRQYALAKGVEYSKARTELFPEK